MKRAAADLAGIGTKFSSNSKRVSNEAILGVEDGSILWIDARLQRRM